MIKAKIKPVKNTLAISAPRPTKHIKLAATCICILPSFLKRKANCGQTYNLKQNLVCVSVHNILEGKKKTKLTRPLVKGAYQKFIFLISKPNICCGYSKEPSQLDGSLGHPKHMFKLMGKEIFTILRSKLCLSFFNKITIFITRKL